MQNLPHVLEYSKSLLDGYCWYKNDVNNKNTYGALYNWYAVNTGKLAPIGWHIPSDNEWIALAGSLGGTIVAGGKLKETGTALWLAPNGEATNESGFTARPGGSRESGLGNFSHKGLRGLWWTSSPAAPEAAWVLSLNNENAAVNNISFQRRYGLSVRCIKD